MAVDLLKTILYRVILPGALLFGAIIRPSYISISYVICALIGPLLPSISSTSVVSPVVRIYFAVVLFISFASLVAQISYQIVDAIKQPDIEEYTKTCNSSVFNFWLRQIGFIRIKKDAGFDAIRVVLPEILAFATSLVAAVCCFAFSRSNNFETDHRLDNVQRLRDNHSLNNISGGIQLSEAFKLALKRLSDIIIILTFGFVGILQPSLLNSVYFFTCLFVTTWWATYKPLHRYLFNTIKLLIVCYAALHFLLIYMYQIPFFQLMLPGGSFAARLIGFTPILYADCSRWWSMSIVSYWTALASALSVLTLYYTLIIQYQCTRFGMHHEFHTFGSGGSSVHEENFATPSNTELTNISGSRQDDENPCAVAEVWHNNLLLADDDHPNIESVQLKRLSSEMDRQLIALSFIGQSNQETTTSKGIITVLTFFLQHCYVFGLLAMMFWALYYHSVFGLIFLVEACIFWVFRDTRSVTFNASPVILAYAEFLLISQYVCSMDIASELPQADYYEIIGFVVASGRTDAFITLLAKSLLSLPLFVLLRLHRRSKHHNSLTEINCQHQLHITESGVSYRGPSQNANETQAYDKTETSKSDEFVSLLSELFTKYWIFVVTLVLLLVSIQTPPVFYTVGYFLFFSILITISLISLECLRRSVYYYWTFLIIYSSIVLVLLYCYQFPSIPAIWRNATGFSTEWNHDIGLINYKEEGDTGALFVRLIAPITFFVVAMLQLKFFHSQWSHLVAYVSSGSTTVSDDSSEEKNLYEKVIAILNNIMETLWRSLEVHMAKLVLLILVFVAVNDVCAINLVLMAFISMAVCIPSISAAMSLFLCTFTSAFIILRMIYQMHFIIEKPSTIVSRELICNSSESRIDVTAYWLGFHKVSNIGNYLSGLILILVSLGGEAVIIYRQRHKRLLAGESTPPKGIIFPEANPSKWDESLVNMFKFFANYGFYKFGLELTMGMMGVVAWVRMDLLGTLILLWLLMFTYVSRTACRRLWPLFLLYLAIMFPLEYAFYVGLPPSLCIEYPWSHWILNPLQNDNLILWLDLASYRVTLNTNKSIADFFLLIMVACQECAFRAESTSPAGDNKSIYRNGDYKLRNDNPHYDFIAHQRSFVDFFKIAMFLYGDWVTIVLVLMAGLGGVSLFALGYIVLAFWMLWQGNSVYTSVSFRKALAQWNAILRYSVVVMLCKVALQLFACVYIHLLKQADLCYLRQLFSMICVTKSVGSETNYYFPEQQEFDNSCPVQERETQIGFDVFAFFFLLIQLRIFNSWYFQYCLLDYRSEAVLMNRGAILKNQLIEKEMKEQNEQQMKKFDAIKSRTAKIRQLYIEQQTTGAFVPQTYGQAKRAGDYYLFDYDPSQDDLQKPVETFVPEITPGATEFEKLDPAQLIHTAVQRDLDLSGTLDAVKSAEKIKNDEKRMIEAVNAETKSLDEKVSLEEFKSGDDLDEDAAESSEKKKTFSYSCMRFIGKLVTSTVGWLAAFMNKLSREHRYVAYVLGKEKENLKRSLRDPLIDDSQPLLEVRQEFDKSRLQCVDSESDIERLENEVQDSWQQRSVFARFIIALGNCIAAHTDIICFVFAIVNNARCGGLISLPLPLLVFFWGTLANPRPARAFWIVMITYTEMCVIIRFICQFGFFPWNNTAYVIKMANSVDYIPGILGVRKEDLYAFWDIVLLVALFFHRHMLRKLGLWKKANISDTFSSSPNDSSTVNVDRPVIEHQLDQTREDTTKTNKKSRKPCSHLSSFFHRLINPKFRYIKDLYPFMFLLDVMCFFVVSMGFSSFGYGGSGSVVKDISSNRVPITFVVMLIVITFMIVIDRALYLRKAVKCKLAYQFLIIAFIHVWIFYILPFITYQPAWLNKTAQFLYFVKCIYLLISAWQIRNGYPALCTGNLITHAYGLANMIFFKIFMALPFLFELRTAIDWTWTDTSMPLFDYFNMENFYAVIYNLKCARTFEKNFPAPRGVPKGIIVKYFMGIPMILVLILVIWLPLLAFSLINRIGIVLLPNNVFMSISIEGYPPLFTVESQGTELAHLTDVEYLFIQNAFSERFNASDQDSILRARQAVAFIKEYTVDDIMKVHFRPESQKPWSISNSALTAMKYELTEGVKTINAVVRLQFEQPRSGESKQPSVHSNSLSIPLLKNSTERNNLAAILNGDYNRNLTLERVFPPYIIVPNEGELKPPATLLAAMHNSYMTIEKTFSDISMQLVTSPNESSLIWSAKLVQNNESVALTLPLETVKYLPGQSEKYIQMVAFVDRVFPTFITKYVQGGVIAMYVAVVLLVGRLIRGIVTNAPLDVMISEIPNPDHLLKICLDIYLVREAKDFVLEQDLFSKLIFLFRSPSTLIRWTRYKAKTE